ncbi:hypothetical protein ACFX2J_042294 [Malus domestica]|nr:protein LTV1 homolog [Malus domestica]XP_028962403.1 protein LTV1 homolog [Malus domestica]
MGKKKFIDKKKSATFQLVARDSSDPNYDDSPGNDRVFVRVDNSSYSVDSLFPEDNPDHGSGADGYNDDPNSIYADAPEDGGGGDYGHGYGSSAASSAAQPLPDNVRKEILELGFPDDGYNYLLHMREIRNTGGGSAFYQNSKAKLGELPRDEKAYDASRLRISETEAPNEKVIYSVASKTVNVRVQKVVDPEVSKLLDDSDVSRFGSDVEDLEEDFVIQANQPEEAEEEEEEEEEEEDGVIDNTASFVEQPENKNVSNEANEAQTYSVAEAKDHSVVEKPRVHRLLDEQFELLVGQEYGSYDNDDDDDYGYIPEEDESLAEKLKHATLNEHVMDDLELDGNYKAPADLLRDNETVKTKELVDSANDLIRRCAEYAEKYEKEDQDGDVVIVEESSDESEVWDCETIVTTYSNLDNHPRKIEAPGATRRKKLSETVSGALGSTDRVITLQGKQKLPVDFLPHGKKATSEKMKDTSALKNQPLKRKQHGQESKEEKKERKAAVKEERREARRTKKEIKELYKGEAQHAQRVVAISGPSSIHLM